MKRPGFAPLVALGLTMIPPVLLYSFCCYVVDESNLDRMPERLFLPLMLWLAVLIFVGHCLTLSLWAAAQLRHNFRSTVISRDLPESRRARWRTIRLTLVRVAGGLAGLVLLSALGVYFFVAHQNSRSHRRWEAFQKQHGDTLKLVRALPPAVPAAENFATSPAFQSLLRKKPQDNSAPALAGSVIRTVIGTYNQNDPTVPWIRQAKLNFDEQIKSSGRKVTARATNSTTTVLERLAGLESELDAIAAAAAAYPNFSPQTNRDRAAVFETRRSEYNLLESLHSHFEFRACARLDVGDFNGAANDALTALRLTRLAAQATDLKASLRAQMMTGRSIQPIWEGLDRRAWTEPQLAAFQSELGLLNLLATYSNNVRHIVLAHIELWNEFGHTPRHRQLVGANSYRSNDQWQPRGWWLDCAIELHSIGKDILANINPETGWMREPGNLRGFYELPLDPEATQTLQQPRWWGNNFSLAAFAQTSANQAIVACGLERYRLAFGKYPDSLDPLVPTYLPRIPTDVLRGRPLLYHLKDGQYTLRGVGPNFKDDSDKAASDDWIWAFGTNAPAIK
jgi:hypothetical protein